MNAGPKKWLGVPNAVDGVAESTSKLNDVLGCTVGQRTLGLGPHKLVRVEFRGIERKPVNMDSPVPTQELLDDDAPVDGNAVPQEYNWSAQVPEKVTQESEDFHAGDVGAVETEVKSKSPPRRGDGKRGDGRNPIPLTAVFENRRLTDRCPGLSHVRNEKEPAFVEKYEMGPKSSGFFLYAGTRASSSGRWLPRLSVWPDVLASGTSIRESSSPATHGRGDSEYRSASGSAWQCAAGSRDLSYILPRERLSPAIVAACASGIGKAAADARVLAWAGERLPHLRESSEPNAPRNLSRRLESRPQTDTSCQLAGELRLDVFVLPAVERSPGVSCPIV